MRALLIAPILAAILMGSPGLVHADEAPTPGTEVPDAPVGDLPGPVEEQEADEAEARALERILRDLDDEAAEPLAKALAKAARKKKAADTLPALEAIAEVKHEGFLKPLIKMLGHSHGRTALRAGELLERRATEDVIKDLWKKGWGIKVNRRRYAVRTKVLRAYGRLGYVLDDKQLRSLKSEWRWMLGNPHASFGPALADIAWYMGTVEDKRFALALAHELDAPASTNVNAANNPSAEWWEARWKQWNDMKDEARLALKRMTGETFPTREAAKTWFQANHKSFGVAWRDFL